jgi:glycosyltransferase involved in cell wall biosynthesis
MKLSLAMIVKGTAEEADHLQKALISTRGIFDEIVIVANTPKGIPIAPEVKKVCDQHKANYYEAVWNKDFAEIRNISFEKCHGEYIFWMDADDTIDKPFKLRQLVEELPPNVDAVFLNYLYEVDEYGAVKNQHLRERVIKNNQAMEWKGRLHETLIDKRTTHKIVSDEVQIIHHADDKRRDAALERNTEILQEQLKSEGDKPDPRTLFYLASCYVDLGAYRAAAEMYELYLQLSGWREERSQAWHQIGNIRRKLGLDGSAKEAYLKAILEDPYNKDPFVSIGEMYYLDQKFEEAVTWIEMALQRPDRKTTVVQNPLNYTYKPLLIYAESQFNLGNIQQAINAAEKANKIRNDELTNEMIKTFKKVQGHQLAAQAFVDLARFLELEGEKDKAKKMFKSLVPKSLMDNPYLLRMRKKYFEPKIWPRNSVVIYTGECSIGNWGPWSLADGIGGSEEAIIRLSKRLVEKGYEVTVYSMPGNRAGKYDGVTWKNYWEFDSRDEFDILIGWRNPWLFENRFKARKTYVWMHDVMPAEEFTAKRLSNITKVMVLSNYHRNLFKNVPDDKIFITANGIDVDDFKGSEKSKRNPHKLIYTSSHTRGLSLILDIWPQVITAVPDARLDIFYGWNSFVAINKDNPERLEWMEKMKQKIAMLDGVTDHGKVSQETIAKETMSSGVWVYPTPFPEISCITAMKCQAGGAVPVVSDYAALDETVQYGYKQHIQEYWDGAVSWNKDSAAKFTQKLIEMLLDEKKQAKIRKKMIPWAKKHFTWDKVADQWDDEFKA